MNNSHEVKEDLYTIGIFGVVLVIFVIAVAAG
jgi:hypothetical protein